MILLLISSKPQNAVHNLFKTQEYNQNKNRIFMTSESHIYCSQKIWLEGTAIEQFNRVLSFPGIIRGAAFPDLHPGRGVPVGAAFLSQDIIYPALIGNDIGCGMTLFVTDMPIRKLKVDKLLRKLGDEPERVLQQLSLDCLPDMPETMDDPLSMLGTIGHGNHFIEILSVEKILDNESWDALNISKDAALLLIHCGSRAYGEALWHDFAAKHGDDGVAAIDDDGKAYLTEHAKLIQWASFNRRLVAKAFSQMLSCDMTELLDTIHNSITPYGDGRFIHRKGASTVETGSSVVVAGSRGTFSYLVKPTGDMQENLASLAHGCGRKWNRQSTKARIREKHNDLQSLIQTSLGTKIVCPDKELLYEEAPEAYKNVEDVIDDLQSFGLAAPIARLRPIINVKP
jgi:release factor H-coupled RctB family protein